MFSDNGIINKAREAADATSNSVNDTEQDLVDLEGSMGEALGQSKVEKGKLVPIDTKYKMYRDSSGQAPIPGGYCVVNDSSANTNNINNIASGLVISDLENDTLDNEPITVDGTSKRGNQFVWVPVSNTELASMYGTDSSGKKHGKLYEFGQRGSQNSSTGLYDWTIYNTPKELNWTETKTTPKVMSITSTTGSREPDILRDTTYGDASTGTANANYNGIEQLKNVVGMATTGTEATEKDNVLKNWEKELQDKFDEMIGSVQKYGGFYIGRYETQGMTTSNTTAVPKVQKGVMPSTDVNWYYMYQESKNIANGNNNVTSSMIWGCQFDRTLDWIAKTNQKDGKPDYSLLTDSRSWGNYSDSTGDAATNRGSKRTSGYNDAWQKNHIYDLAGNVWDWTIEADYTAYRVYRGGVYDSPGTYGPTSVRFSSYPSFSLADHR